LLNLSLNPWLKQLDCRGLIYISSFIVI
jgi:hypothetical protein